MEQNEKKKRSTLQKNLLEVYHDYSQIVNAMAGIKEIRFREEKLNALELTKTFEHFQPV